MISYLDANTNEHDRLEVETFAEVVNFDVKGCTDADGNISTYVTLDREQASALVGQLTEWLTRRTDGK